MMVSLAVVEVPIGVGIGVALWKFLGERTIGIIAQSEAMMKYSHLRTMERGMKQYVINLKTQKGFLMPIFLQKLAGEGLIQRAKDTESDGISWSEVDAAFEDIQPNRAVTSP